MMKEMDGFFTLVIPTAEAMSVVRDAFACKPAVVAETRRLRRRGVRVPGPGRASRHRRRGRVRAPTRGGLHVEPLNCDDLGTRAVNSTSSSAGPAPTAGRAPPLQPRGRHNLAVGLCRHRSRSPSRATPATSSAVSAATRDGSGPDIVVDGFVGWSVGENLMGGIDPGAGAAPRRAPAPVPGAADLHRGRRLPAGRDLPQGRHAGHRRGRRGHVGVHGPGRHRSSSAATPGTDWATRSTRRSSTSRGTIASLGADAVVEEMTDDDVLAVKDSCEETGFDHIDPTGSPRWPRPASSTTSRRTTMAPTDGDTGPRVDAHGPTRPSRPRSSPASTRWPRPASTRSAGWAPGASCRPSTTSSS